MNYLIVGKFGIPSIKSIASKLVDVNIIKNFNGIWRKWNGEFWIRININFTNQDKVIRWGCTTPVRFNGAKIYNRSDAINLASNKYDARMRMQECGVPIPKTNRHNLVDMDFPIIARPLKHRGGKEFDIITSPQDYGMYLYRIGHLNIDRYFSEVYDKQQEYRVHVAFGKILSIQEKPLVEGIIQANQAQTHESWRVLPWHEYRRDVCKVAVDAVKAIGLDNGAVDIMIDRRNSTMPICVCEVNTAPSLDKSPYDQERYSKYINWLFRSDREWFNYEEWQAGKSYAFKNFQLEE